MRKFIREMLEPSGAEDVAPPVARQESTTPMVAKDPELASLEADLREKSAKLRQCHEYLHKIGLAIVGAWDGPEKPEEFVDEALTKIFAEEEVCEFDDLLERSSANFQRMKERYIRNGKSDNDIIDSTGVPLAGTLRRR